MTRTQNLEAGERIEAQYAAMTLALECAADYEAKGWTGMAARATRRAAGHKAAATRIGRKL